MEGSDGGMLMERWRKERTEVKKNGWVEEKVEGVSSRERDRNAVRDGGLGVKDGGVEIGKEKGMEGGPGRRRRREKVSLVLFSFHYED